MDTLFCFNALFLTGITEGLEEADFPGTPLEAFFLADWIDFTARAATLKTRFRLILGAF